jgi:hypothetical protein
LRGAPGSAKVAVAHAVAVAVAVAHAVAHAVAVAMRPRRDAVAPRCGRAARLPGKVTT